MALNLPVVFAAPKPDLSADLAEDTPTIYQNPDAKYDNFNSHNLVSIYCIESARKVWERRHAGHEIAVLPSGTATITIREEKADEAFMLTEPGAFVVKDLDDTFARLSKLDATVVRISQIYTSELRKTQSNHLVMAGMLISTAALKSSIYKMWAGRLAGIQTILTRIIGILTGVDSISSRLRLNHRRLISLRKL